MMAVQLAKPIDSIEAGAQIELHVSGADVDYFAEAYQEQEVITFKFPYPTPDRLKELHGLVTRCQISGSRDVEDIKAEVFFVVQTGFSHEVGMSMSSAFDLYRDTQLVLKAGGLPDVHWLTQVREASADHFPLAMQEVIRLRKLLKGVNNNAGNNEGVAT